MLGGLDGNTSSTLGKCKGRQHIALQGHAALGATEQKQLPPEGPWDWTAAAEGAEKEVDKSEWKV